MLSLKDAVSPHLSSDAQDSISYLALKGLRAMQALVSRPVARRPMLVGLSMAAVIPAGSPAHLAFIELFR